MKTCTKCRVEKEENQFVRDATNPDNLKIWCRQCTNEYHRDWSKKNKSKIKRYWELQYSGAKKQEYLKRRRAGYTRDSSKILLRNKKYYYSVDLVTRKQKSSTII